MLFPTLGDPRFFTPFQALRQLERFLAEPEPSAAPLRFALYTRGDDLLLQTALPGVEAKDLSLEIKDDTLTLKARWPSEPQGDDVVAQHVERPRGEFVRSLHLPFEIDAARVQARLENGVLEIELPRLPKAAPVKIQLTPEAPKN